jgi:hypothetical protein
MGTITDDFLGPIFSCITEFDPEYGEIISGKAELGLDILRRYISFEPSLYIRIEILSDECPKARPRLPIAIQVAR